MQTTSYSLKELLRRVRDKNLTIPQFQRKFIWRESQVKLLIDSISRSYPIGSLLILDKEPNFQLASRSIEAEIRSDFSTDDDEYQSDTESYILDGQQRTTSIARVFLNAHPEKLYYFDLKAMLELHPQEEPLWVCTRPRGKKHQDRKGKDPDRRDNNKLLRADMILDQPRTDVYVSEYIEDSGDFPEYNDDRRGARDAAAKIKGIFERIRNYKIPVVSLERDQGIESICRVFETINSTGTRLKTFDLAVAKFYPEPNLRELWEDAQDKHSILEDFAANADESVPAESILKVSYLVFSKRESKQYLEPSRGNLLALPPEVIRQEWDKSSEALAKTYQWARDQGARPGTLPSHSVLVPLAAIWSAFSDDLSKPVWPDDDFIRRWYFSKILQTRVPREASNYQIGQDFDALSQYIDRESTPDIYRKVGLSPDTILEIKPSDVRFKALQNIFATTVRGDLVSGYIINSESELHDHHIYPRSLRKKDRERFSLNKLDNICNRIPILASSNRSLRDKCPQEYFREMAEKAHENGTLNALQTRLHDCMIPGDLNDESWLDNFSIGNFDEFCRKRAELIFSRVHHIIGDSMKDGQLSEDDMIGEDED